MSDSPETKKCPYCGETILAIAKKCKHCGEFLDETARVAAMPSAEEIKATKLRVQETDVMGLKLPGGYLNLTTKKIRGKVKATERLPTGVKVTAVQDIDTLLSLVTSTTIVKARFSIVYYVALIACLLLTIALHGVLLSYVFGFVALCILCVLCSRRYVLVISMGGKDLQILIKNKETANQFVEAVRKTKAEYELKAGL